MPAVKKPKPFIRAAGSHYDKEKWKTVIDKTKFERKLDDMAYRTDLSFLRRGDLFYSMNYDSSPGWTDDDEDWPAFRTAMSNMSSQFAEARANAYYN